MAEILKKNYEVAKKVRDRQIINNLNQYKNINHNSNNPISAFLTPKFGHAVFVDFPGKYNSLKFGVIVKIHNVGSIRIKFQDKSIKDIPAKLVHPLIIPELGGIFQNKVVPLPNGKN